MSQLSCGLGRGEKLAAPVTLIAVGQRENMNTELSPFEKIAYSTIRIECDTASGLSTGTGFFFRFADKGDVFVPGIVTNKHVIKDSIRGRLLFTISKEDGKPDVGNNFLWTIDEFESAWIPHPEPEVDLCVLPIATLINQANAQGKKFFTTYLDMSLLPSDSEVEDFVGMERIVMVGYPNGIWDRLNNFPVLRSGVAATHYRYDWNGRPEFLIDCACFPGSSGSPVLVCDIGQVHTKKGLNIGTSRIKLLGALYAGPQHRVDGRVEIVPVSTVDRIVSVSSIPNNLGMVIKAKKLLELDEILKKIPNQTGEREKPRDPPHR
jgi:V8-like Glu-specific endopeptidase